MEKKHRIVMLPTEKTNSICFRNYLFFNKDNITTYSNVEFKELYILFDEEIKENDWFIHNNQLYKAEEIGDYIKTLNKSIELPKEDCKKIIATTDKSLHFVCDHCNTLKTNHERYCSHCGKFGTIEIELFQIPQSFIEYFVSEYNKGNVITDVMVEYYESHIKELEDLLKINSDNTININLVKNSVQIGEELYSIMQQYYKYCVWKEYITPMKWIEENL